MALNINWLPQSEFTRDNIFNNISHNWGELRAIAFIVELDHLIIQISQGNVQYQRFPAGNCYRVPITRQNTLYYDVVGNRLDILTVWDTRQEPSKLLESL